MTNNSRNPIGVLMCTLCVVLVCATSALAQTLQRPLPPRPLPPGPTDFVDITAGNDHTCAIRYNGNVYCWGKNDLDQIGVFNTKTLCGSSLAPINCLVKPIFVIAAAQIEAGIDHTCALSGAGAATCWGDSNYGQLGAGVYGYSGPLTVSGGHVFSSISAGMYSTCGTATDGVYCWGAIIDTVHGAPVPVNLLPFSGLTGLTVGYSHACALEIVGGWRGLDCWGNNRFGQMGIDPALFVNSPPNVTLRSSLGTSVSRVTTQSEYTCADQSTGVVQCVGENESGQLGNGQTTNALTFEAQTVISPVPLHGVTTGLSHACALNAAGNAFCWGANTYGELGNGGIIDASTAQAVSSTLAFRKVVAGWHHTCGIGTDNHIYCWGSNSYGQLGVNVAGGWTLNPMQAIDPS